MKASELKNLDVGEMFQKLQELDFENIGSWPAAVKYVFALVVLGLVLLLGYLLNVSDLYGNLEQARGQERTLMSQLEQKAHRAQNLEQYKQQLVEMEETFGTLLQQLPRETEVPGLLEDITHTGLGSGLEFDKIQLEDETVREFYAELPIRMTVRGDYHGMGTFVSGVAALPRIVTLHDFDIVVQSGSGRPESRQQGNRGDLVLNVLAKTYRYSPASAPTPASRGTARNQR